MQALAADRKKQTKTQLLLFGPVTITCYRLKNNKMMQMFTRMFPLMKSLLSTFSKSQI